jgi:putative oxidoreductase
LLSQTFYVAWTPRALGALRIVTAFLFLQHATAKLFHVPHVEAFDALPAMSFFGFVGIFELVFGVLVLVGLFTRASAFLLSGQMAVAYFVGHAPQGNVLAPMLNQGESAVLFSFIYLLLAVAGAGAWSLDAARSRAAA